MYIKPLITLVVITALASCGNDISTPGSSNSSGSATLTGTAMVGETLTASLSDADGVQQSTVSYSWYSVVDDDISVIDLATGDSFVVTGAEYGGSVEVHIRYTDGGGITSAATAASEVVAGEAPATFSGLTVTILADEPTASGTVTVSDPNPDEDLIEAQAGTITDFGTFSIMPTGEWDYTLDTGNAAIADLGDGDSETDTILIESADGTTANLVITISGTAPPQVAVIRDTTGDTGELRYQLFDDTTVAAIQAGTDDGLLQGRVEVSFTRRDDSFGSGDAFISLFNFETNNNGAILDLRIRDDNFGVRNPEFTVDTGLATPILDAETLDDFQTAVITWDYVNGRDMAPEVTVEIDGTPITTDAFEPDNAPFGGVTHIGLRFGDNSGTRPAEATFTIGDWAIYSDTAGTVSVFADDFSSYSEGSLDDDNVDSPYASETSEAVVEIIADDPGSGGGGGGSADNQFAFITDTSSADTGELRRDLDSALLQGRMTVSVRKEATQDGFINLSGDSTTRANAMIDMRINDTNGYEFTESGTSVNATANFPAFVVDEWVDIEITWDASAVGVAPEITVTIDGQDVTAGAFSSEGTLANIAGGVETIQFRLGGGSSSDVSGAGFSIDDLRVYSDTAGTTMVLVDEFETYTVGNSLDPNAVDAGSGPIPDAIVEPGTPYTSNSFQVTVEEE